MKVAVLLAPTPPPYGGIAGWTERMIKEELRNDWHIELVDEKLIGKRDSFGDTSKRNIFSEVRRCLSIWYRLCKALRGNDVEVVHSCIPSYTLSMMREYVCALLTKIFNKKFIIHFRCTIPNTTKGRMGYFMLKRLCNISDYIIVLNKKSMDCIKLISKTKVEIIPNFVSENEVLNTRIINEDIKTAIYTGGIIEEKGTKVIIEVAKRNPDVVFKLIGETDREIVDFGKDVENVVFMGTMPRDSVKKELRNADVFLFLSFFRGEGFSNALAEAMASGLPCIVTDWAANKDMVEDKGGIVVPINDIQASIAAFEKINDYELRKSQSDFNIAKIKQFYLDIVVIDKYVDTYEEVICMDGVE